MSAKTKFNKSLASRAFGLANFSVNKKGLIFDTNDRGRPCTPYKKSNCPAGRLIYSMRLFYYFHFYVLFNSISYDIRHLSMLNFTVVQCYFRRIL